MIKDNIPLGDTALFYGGYPEAERVVFGAFPEWDEPDEDEFPISCIKISRTYARELSHRDYLGSVLGLGIERMKIGDIKIDGSDAYVFAYNDIADFIVRNLTKVGSCGVKCAVLDKSDIKPIKQEYIFKDAVCASTRFDAVVSAAYNLPRSTGAKLISGKTAMLNHREITDVSKEIKPGDLISVKGYGRFILDSVGKTTSKGRRHITLKFYK